jgi:hypothetical protein
MDLATANEIFINRPHRKELAEAVKLEAETRFYTERFRNDDKPLYFNEFMQWVDDRLNNDNSINNFKNSITYPLKSASLIDSIYKELARIWDAENPYLNISYTDKNIQKPITELIDLNWWRSTGWELLKTKYNCILLVNLPQEQLTDEPNPFIEIIDICDVIDVNVKGNKINSIMYWYDYKTVATIDNMAFQLYATTDKDQSLSYLTYEKPNITGKCPAFFLSNVKYNNKNDIVRCNPITNNLGQLKNLVFLTILKSITDPHSFYHFIVKYGSTGCTYSNGIEHCEGGYLYTALKDSKTGNFKSVGIPNKSGQGLKKCTCNGSLGIGNEVSKVMSNDPIDKELANVLQFISPDPNSLKYSEEYLQRYEDNIYASIVGNEQVLNPKMNHNEMAYQYSVEGMQAVLMDWKKLYDTAIYNTTEAKVLAIYGNVIASLSVDLGNDFLLSDVNALYTEKENAKKTGLDVVLNFNDRIIETKYKNNPDQKERAKLINAFKPFDEPMVTIEASYISRAISKKDYFKSKYLEQFITNYEYAIMPISSLIFNKGIDIALVELNTAFDDFFTLKTLEVETSQKMLAEVIGVGGTQALITIITDPILDAKQKNELLQLLFNMDAETATKVATKTALEPITK